MSNSSIDGTNGGSDPIKDCPGIGAPWPYHVASETLPVYVLETFELDRAGQANSVLLADEYLAVARGDGWRRVFLAGALTGPPGAVAQLWRLDTPYPGTPGTPPPAALPSLLRGYVDFVQHLTNFRRVLLGPMPYFDETVDVPPADKPPLLIVQLNVKDGAMARFSCIKKNFFKPTVKLSNWGLVFAGHGLTGPQSSVVNVWSLPDENSLPQVMLAMDHNAIYQGELAPLIAMERQNLYRLQNTNT